MLEQSSSRLVYLLVVFAGVNVGKLEVFAGA